MHNDQPPEISGIEEIRIVDPDDYVSRHARLHREAGRRTTPLELENWTPKKAARIPRDNEPAPLWVVCGLVAFIGLCLVLVTGGAMHVAGLAADVAVTYVNALVDALLRWIGGAL